MAAPYGTGFLARIVDCHFGSAWLLLNVDVSGFIINGAPPPFGSFAFTPASGSNLLDQKQIAKSQSNQTIPNTFWFPWPDVVAAPTTANYNTLLPDIPSPPPTHVYSVVNGTGIFWPSDPLFPIPDKGFWYSSLAKVTPAVNFLNANFNVILPGSSYPFTHLDGSHQLFPLPVHFTAQSVSTTTTQGTTNLNVKFLFQIPTNTSALKFKFSVPGAPSVGQGWASVFTAQKKAIRHISDLQGDADQSVYFPGTSIDRVYTVSTLGTKGKGRVAISGQTPQTPGLPPDAPFSPS